MVIKNKELELFTFDQIKDEFIGEIGTEKRAQYEQELQLEVFGDMILNVRLERHLIYLNPRSKKNLEWR